MTRPALLAAIAFTCLLTACGTGGKFVKCFQKRKYRRGYYMDGHAGQPRFPDYLTYSGPLNGLMLPLGIGTKAVYRANCLAGGVTRMQKGSAITIPMHYSKASTGVALKKINPPYNKDRMIPLIALPDDLDSLDMGKKDYNYLAITGCSLCAAGAIATLAAHTALIASLTYGSIILLSLGLIIGIISLFSKKYYLNWLAIVGFGIIAALFILDLL